MSYPILISADAVRLVDDFLSANVSVGTNWATEEQSVALTSCVVERITGDRGQTHGIRGVPVS